MSIPACRGSTSVYKYPRGCIVFANQVGMFDKLTLQQQAFLLETNFLSKIGKIFCGGQETFIFRSQLLKVREFVRPQGTCQSSLSLKQTHTFPRVKIRAFASLAYYEMDLFDEVHRRKMLFH